MKTATITLALGAAASSAAEAVKYLISTDGIADWALLPNSQPSFPKSKRKKVGKPKSRPSRRQRNKFRRR